MVCSTRSSQFLPILGSCRNCARSGLHHQAVEFAKQIFGERKEGLPKVLDALTDMGAKDEVKALLPLCGWATATALDACRCLIRLHPFHALLMPK
ncbi:MAG: hypothetical protein NZ781_12770 [Armatimonadetes bacterium]|nr:hypothetical protein [Armatimonadota bacterium]